LDRRSALLLRTIALVLVLAAPVACGAETAPPSSIPSDAVAALKASPVRSLAADDVADDALRPQDLAAILDDAGYRSGAERAFTGRFDVRSVTVRVLAFDSPSGVETYLGWLRDNAKDVIGSIDVSATIPVRGSEAPVYGHLPGGCCPKDTPVYLTGWSDGSNAVTVLAIGPGVDQAVVTEVAADIDRTIGGKASDA